MIESTTNIDKLISEYQRLKKKEKLLHYLLSRYNGQKNRIDLFDQHDRSSVRISKEKLDQIPTPKEKFKEMLKDIYDEVNLLREEVYNDDINTLI